MPEDFPTPNKSRSIFSPFHYILAMERLYFVMIKHTHTGSSKISFSKLKERLMVINNTIHSKKDHRLIS